MELKAEQIKKELEWCSELRLCVDCPMRAEGYFSHSRSACRQVLMKNALTLINSQEQRIKELTEENERLREEAYRLECDLQLNADEKAVAKAIEQTKKATVRKMQERFNEKVAKLLISPSIQYQASAFIDQIAKEMLEGVT